MTAPLLLLPPALGLLPAYASALGRGWSPDTTHDVSRKQLAAIRADPQAFLAELSLQAGTFRQPDGRETPRLPSRQLWIWDGAFCGTINVRWQPGSLALPSHVSGHVGYAVVPWKRRLGYATRALGLLLPVCREVGLTRVTITCDEGNLPSRKVIEANGGVLVGTAPHPLDPAITKLVFEVATIGTRLSPAP